MNVSELLRWYERARRPLPWRSTRDPYALVIGCLDSRVPPEGVFDQDFGAVVVVRTGGHVLDAAGLGSVEFAVTARPSTLGQRYLWYQAAALVRFGIPRDVALKSVTLVPARALGLEKSKGSLEVGKDGDLLVLTADPLSGQAWVDTGVIEGKVVYERRTDRRLAEPVVAIPARPLGQGEVDLHLRAAETKPFARLGNIGRHMGRIE